MLDTYHKQGIKKKIKVHKTFSSLGLVIPFQPSMWDDKTVLAELMYAMKTVSKALREKYTSDCADKVLHRLEKIFAHLNFNTLRKSVAIVLEPANEKIIYLSFIAKPVLFFGKSISLLNLVTNVPGEADFHFLVFDEGNVRIYEYCNRLLGQVYEQKKMILNGHTGNGVDGYHMLFTQIALINYGYKKPLFISGKEEEMEMFLSKSPFAAIVFKKINPIMKYPIEIIRLMALEISFEWSSLQQQFIAGRIKLAAKSNTLIGNKEAVLLALRKNQDGLLLLDKRLNKQLQKSKPPIPIFKEADELLLEMERFLMRGNMLQITETGLLKNFGGITLLAKENTYLEEAFFYRHNEPDGSQYQTLF
jgi:hypothetical protein